MRNQEHPWIEASWKGRADVFREQSRIRCGSRRGERRQETVVGMWLDRYVTGKVPKGEIGS